MNTRRPDHDGNERERATADRDTRSGRSLSSAIGTLLKAGAPCDRCRKDATHYFSCGEKGQRMLCGSCAQTQRAAAAAKLDRELRTTDASRRTPAAAAYSYAPDQRLAEAGLSFGSPSTR